MYRTIDTKFWTDPKVRKLSADARYLMLYLITNPAAHLCGIYYLPDVTIAHEIGYPIDRVFHCWPELADAGLARRDQENEIVFVVNMMRYQGRGAKNEASAATHIKTLHNSSLVNEFRESYPSVSKRISDRVSDRVFHPTPELAAVRTQEQEQEQEQKEESGGVPPDPADKPPIPPTKKSAKAKTSKAIVFPPGVYERARDGWQATYTHRHGIEYSFWADSQHTRALSGTLKALGLNRADTTPADVESTFKPIVMKFLQAPEDCFNPHDLPHLYLNLAQIREAIASGKSFAPLGRTGRTNGTPTHGNPNRIHEDLRL